MNNKQRVMCLAPGRASPGMALAKPVFDHEGSVLLTAETVLDEAMFKQMIRRCVYTISVYVADNRDEAMIERELADIRERVDMIFRGTGNAARDQLRDAILDYRIEKAR
ncbi:MAG: hypothetical protein LBU43_07055 [Candidatus Accumulibacter sp.]|jgi:hypothetical protein|nr:hypothetical protein [Accumulibacter sp.]